MEGKKKGGICENVERVRVVLILREMNWFTNGNCDGEGQETG